MAARIPFFKTQVALAVGALASYPWMVDFCVANMAKFQLIDPENAHQAFIKAGEYGILPDVRHWTWRIGVPNYDESKIKTTIWGHKLTSPVGIAAGLDKNAQIIDPLLGLGFGFVEIGSVTPKPQEGNPKPRVFRLPKSQAIINRYGFNSEGIDGVKPRLENWKSLVNSCLNITSNTRGMLGINLGKNKTTVDAAGDYILGLQELGPYADYLVINVSSPNTPGLRALQGSTEMDKLLQAVLEAKKSIDSLKDIPLLVKIAPDLTPQERADIAQIALNHHVDGLVISNTTVERPDSLDAQHKSEVGGLSGAPLKERSLQLLSEMYKLTHGKITLISVGGVDSGEEAYKRIKSGASLVQLYTAMTFKGPGLVSHINQTLATLVAQDGFSNVTEAIGKDVPSSKQ